MLRYPDDIYPLLKMKRAIEKAERQIPPEPHWGFCYSMLHKVSRSFSLVIQQLGTELRNAVRSSLSKPCLIHKSLCVYLYMRVLVFVWLVCGAIQIPELTFTVDVDDNWFMTVVLYIYIVRATLSSVDC